jgi:GH25 family lysozyme M1 (1,4-beta-N-acetylmuramidase)
VADYGLVIDSSNNDPVTGPELKAAGAVALIAKGTEGDFFQDKTLASQRQAAKQAGVPFGAFLFLHARSQGNEAEYFLSYVKPKRGVEMDPIIDAERGGLDKGTVAELAERADQCARVFEAKGWDPILYADYSTWLAMFAAKPGLNRLRVWEAQYPGRFTRWFPRIARLRLRLLHGASVVLWQWTSTFQIGSRHYDASRAFVPLASLISRPAAR